MSFATVRLLRRSRRFSLGEPAGPGIGAYEDFESSTLNFGDWHLGWAGTGIVYSYNAAVAYENFETSTLTNNSAPNFGWASDGTILFSPTVAVPAPAGVGETVSFVVSLTGVSGTPSAYQWYRNGIAMTNTGAYSGVTTATMTITGVVSGDYVAYFCAVTMIGVTRNSTSATLIDQATDWANRVVTNGGATPSVGTVSAIRTFWNGVISDGLSTNILALNVFAPDSLKACFTPLVQGNGLALWTSAAFVAGDLTVNGLGGRASSNVVTGIVPSTLFTSDNSAGASVYHYAGTTDGMYFGYNNAFSTCFFLQRSGGSLVFCAWQLASVAVSGAQSPAHGFFSANRTGATTSNIYSANSGTAFSSIASGSSTPGARSGVNSGVSVFNMLPNLSWDMGLNTISFIAFHQGLSSSGSQALYNRTQALRVSLGGGFN